MVVGSPAIFLLAAHPGLAALSSFEQAFLDELRAQSHISVADCAAVGVTCSYVLSAPVAITKIILSSQSLTGTIPALSGLASLIELNYASNQLSGTLPVMNAALTTLDVRDNLLVETSGAVLPALVACNLSGNPWRKLQASYISLPCSSSVLCPAGKECSAGLLDIEAAAPCAPGYSCAEGGLPAVCSSGSYCPTGSTAPVQCPAGYSCGVDAASLVSCPAGFHCGAGSATPTVCDAGFFCVSGAALPAPCAVLSKCTSAGLAVPGSYPAALEAGVALCVKTCSEGDAEDSVYILVSPLQLAWLKLKDGALELHTVAGGRTWVSNAPSPGATVAWGPAGQLRVVPSGGGSALWEAGAAAAGGLRMRDAGVLELLDLGGAVLGSEGTALGAADVLLSSLSLGDALLEDGLLSSSLKLLVQLSPLPAAGLPETTVVGPVVVLKSTEEGCRVQCSSETNVEVAVPAATVQELEIKAVAQQAAFIPAADQWLTLQLGIYTDRLTSPLSHTLDDLSPALSIDPNFQGAPSYSSPLIDLQVRTGTVFAKLGLGNGIGDAILVENLVAPFSFTICDVPGLTASLKQESELVKEFRCSWYDESNSFWSNQGCQVVNASTDRVTCECNHMTTFRMERFAEIEVNLPSQDDFNKLFMSPEVLLERPAPLLTVCGLLFLYLVGVPVVTNIDKRKFKLMRHSVAFKDGDKLGVWVQSYNKLAGEGAVLKLKQEATQSGCCERCRALWRLTQLRFGRHHGYSAVFRRDPDDAVSSRDLWLLLLIGNLTMLAINALFYGTSQDASSLPSSMSIPNMDPKISARGMMPGYPSLNALAQGLVSALLAYPFTAGLRRAFAVRAPFRAVPVRKGVSGRPKTSQMVVPFDSGDEDFSSDGEADPILFSKCWNACILDEEDSPKREAFRKAFSAMNSKRKTYPQNLKPKFDAMMQEAEEFMAYTSAGAHLRILEQQLLQRLPEFTPDLKKLRRSLAMGSAGEQVVCALRAVLVLLAYPFAAFASEAKLAELLKNMHSGRSSLGFQTGSRLHMSVSICMVTVESMKMASSFIRESRQVGKTKKLPELQEFLVDWAEKFMLEAKLYRDGWIHRSNENKGVLLWARVCAWTMIAGLIFVVLLWGIAIDRIGEEQRQNPAFAPVYGLDVSAKWILTWLVSVFLDIVLVGPWTIFLHSLYTVVWWNVSYCTCSPSFKRKQQMNAARYNVELSAQIHKRKKGLTNTNTNHAWRSQA